MNSLKLVEPAMAHKDNILDYKKEFVDNGDSMDGTAGLSGAESFEDWLSNLQANTSEETVKEGLVPASTYIVLAEDSNRIVGMIDIRHRLNDYLLKHGGHIGYSVRKTERRKGYATEILGLGLKKCREIGINEVLITCYKDNIGSVKTIIKNGGVLENEISKDNAITQRYWTKLS